MNVRIVKAQRINRVWYEVGDIVLVGERKPGDVGVFSEREVAWLIAQRIAESVDEVSIPTPPRPSGAPRAAAPRPKFEKVRFKCCGWSK